MRARPEPAPNPTQRPIRVMVVDDVLTIRRLVADALSADPAIQVVGSAADGRQALARLEGFRPDIVILDLEMPVMGGLEALAEIRRAHPRLPVIVYSSATRQGGRATLEALWLGANDCVAKPRARSSAAAVEQVRRDLAPRIRALCGPVGLSLRGETAPAGERMAPLAPASADRRPVPVEVVVIGASTGGPRALATLFQNLPAALPVPLLVVQHMPAFFTRHFAEGLRRRTGVPLEEAIDGAPLEPGRAWLAPGDQHMTVRRGARVIHLDLGQGAPENGCRPSLDPLMRSVVGVYGAAAVAVILTGMGQDGLAGCRALHAAGGSVLVQDEASSVVWGMPGAIARAGLAEAVLAPENLAAEIRRRIAMPRAHDPAA